MEYHLQDTAACVAFADAGEKCVCVWLHLQRRGIWQKFLKFNTFFCSPLLNSLLLRTFYANRFCLPVNPCPKVVLRP